jgi:leucine-rich repeat protein SHOC2
LGNLYPLVKRVEQLNDKVTALDLTNSSISNLPLFVYKNTQLKIILLGFNNLKSIDSEFKNLTNLSILNLKGNLIPIEEQEKIKKLLPNCKIEF